MLVMWIPVRCTFMNVVYNLWQVITVEPGCYFIEALLYPAMESANLSKFLNFTEIEKFWNFGGVRIESDVVSPLL